MKSILIPLFIAAFAFAMGGCAAMGPKMPPLASIEGVQGHFAEGRIVDLANGKSISFDELMDDLQKMDLIFVGEVHDNPEHHLIEVQILQGLTACYGPLSVGMEFFDTTQQSAIDRYIGKEVSETVFLKEVDWAKRWSFPYHFYRPLLLLAREEGNPLIGINVPNTVVRKVARSGIESLTPEERTYVAEEIDLNNEAHRLYVTDVFKEHAHGQLKDFDHFYQAQCVWEETMAQNIARRLKEDPGRMVVFTGNGHIVERFGIPDRVLRRMPAKMATILLYPLTERLILNKNMADYVWLTGGCSAGGHGQRAMRLRKMGEMGKNETITRKN